MNMIETNFLTYIQFVQSDGGKVFPFLTKLGDVGLQHKLTCPHS